MADIEQLDKRAFEAELQKLVRARQSEHFSEKCVQMVECSGCSYSTFCERSSELTRCHYCSDCTRCTDCSHCSEGQALLGCHQCDASAESISCSYLKFCRSLSHCHYCFGCVGLSHSEFHILNQPYDRSEYFRLTRKLQERWGQSTASR